MRPGVPGKAWIRGCRAREAGDSNLNVEDRNQLLPYLEQRGELSPGESAQCINLAGGVSNRTVKVVRDGGPNLIVKQALSKLRVEADWYSSPERIHREFMALRIFGALLPGQVPPVHMEDSAHHIIVMEEVPTPHINWKDQMLAGSVEPDHWTAFGTMLIRIHTATHRERAALPARLRDRSFFETLRLEPYYRYSSRQMPDAAGFLHRLITTTLDRTDALVHGDYSPKNVLIQNHTLHLLDYEVCHIGDPAFDVGFGLTHALSKAHKLPRRQRECLTGASRFWRAYFTGEAQEIWGAALEQRAVHHTLACLLARAVGKSPLEYLSQQQKQWQAQVAADLMQRGYDRIPDLIEGFRLRLRETADLDRQECGNAPD